MVSMVGMICLQICDEQIEAPDSGYGLTPFKRSTYVLATAEALWIKL